MFQKENSVIFTQNLTREVGGHLLLDGVSFSLCRGDILGVVGHSGSGKSTLVRCLDFLEFPTSGCFRIDEFQYPITPPRFSRSSFAKKIAYISQNYGLFSAKTVFDNIAYPLRIHYPKMASLAVSCRVMEVLESLDMEHKKYAYPGSLSGGQKQKVAIARALVLQPSILLCDEVTSALDPKSTEDIIYRLKSLNQEMQVTQIIISHEMDVIRELCSKVLVLSSGKNIAFGDTSKVLSSFSQHRQRDFTCENLTHQ
ncbi:ABC transporter family protein [Chlamydia ibidis]|uniref:ABC transporter family protein n=2 Tax=Chlamydia ibidis TaxID=1405396 RepID=S7KFY4_9CHLA|nr:ATP-binding cassette domain-containing protein [Chlamydia ibidis]EPP35096.1 ABC transporter family protein [Chlamydia ibidis]EQM62583.1 ABC transporter family protein [Chlamydia ibidis 10-1398/6]